jgi:transcriptional regulator with GAF, ATPase, and Fis domain
VELLLRVWREACRHIDIDQSIDRIARQLATRVPAEFVLVRRFDATRAILETAAMGCCRAEVTPAPALPARTECTARQLTDLLRWIRAGEVRRGPVGSDPLAPVLVPAGLSTGEFIAGPLIGEDGPLGVMVIVASAAPLTTAHEALARALLEPIGVALANDARLHEMARLREALEADKRALLSRLDRQDVADSIVGAEAGLRTVMHRVAQVAATDAPVLIIGETGSGKEVVARAVHARSRRAAAPIVRVNCGAIPSGLVDSELFGHERGSFTGAIATRLGWFERADGGTLFLDEIGELPLEAQVRLLRILQDGTFERVGGQKTLRVDVRIVAATHRDLAQMVADGSFREDLWYRIGIFPIALPPLRERPEDVPMLAAHFARRAGVRLAGAPLALTRADTEMLLAYSWPGNVRELAAVIERAAILGRGHGLEVAAALGFGEHPALPPRGAMLPPPPDAAATLTLDAAMRRHVEGALEAAAGRIEGPSGAAVRLGVNPHTLRGRMRRLGITWRAFRRPLATGSTSGRAEDGGRSVEAASRFDAAMRDHIETALSASYGRIEGPLGAAVRLGVNPHTLRARMRRLGIDWRRYRVSR